MVLRMFALVVGVTSAFGCRQSLFDSHGEGRDTHIDAAPGETCPAPCLGDSGSDFDGTPNGQTGRWRYLEDQRNRTWTPMTAMDNGFVGANPSNTIQRCAVNSDLEACQALPRALLVSTAGVSTPADPAIEFTAEANRTIELQVAVHIPTGGFGQTVRLYRNSREDVLFTGVAEAGTTFRHTMTLDALAGDRFLVAIVPPALGQPQIAVQLHVVGANATFPTECQLAVTFSALAGGMTDNVCSGSKLTAKHDAPPGMPSPMLTAGPYPELGTAANFAQHNYYSGAAVLSRPGDVTLDLWVKQTTLLGVFPDAYAWVFSERNRTYNLGGGLYVDIYRNSSGELKIEAGTTYTDIALGRVDVVAVDFAYPTDQNWHFLRVSHKKDGPMKVCFDGVFKGMEMARGTLKPNNPPYIADDPISPTDPQTFVGAIDDVRVLNTALPCD